MGLRNMVRCLPDEQLRISRSEAAEILEGLPFVTEFSVKERQAVAIAVDLLRGKSTQSSENKDAPILKRVYVDSYISEDDVCALIPVYFCKYLAENGWSKFSTKRCGIAIYQKESEENFYQITIPLNRKLSDYVYAMKTAVRTLAEAENISVEHVVKNIRNFHI